MIVTKIEAVTKTKYKVYVEEQFAFVLYKGELSRYCLAEGKEVSEEVVRHIKDEVLLKRAKMRCMHLLKDMDRTEAQLTTKLKQGYYTEDVIEKAIEYVKSFGYLNDNEYARRYVSSQKGKKSRKQIYAELSKKRLEKNTISQVLEEDYEARDEKEAIRAIIKKRRYDPETASQEDKQKIYAYLARKGFAYDDICSVLQVSEWNA